MSTISPELTALRAEAADPFRGKPDRVQVMFRMKDIENRDGREALNRWWRDEAVPVIENMTGGRAFVQFGSCFVSDETTAVLLRIFFHGFVFGMLDWQDMNWITINEDVPLPPL